MAGYRYVSETRGQRYVSTRQASEMLGGVLSVNTLAMMIKAGKIAGAIKASDRYFIPRNVVDTLIVDMSNGLVGVPAAVAEAEAERPLVWHDRRAHTTFDAAVS